MKDFKGISHFQLILKGRGDAFPIRVMASLKLPILPSGSYEGNPPRVYLAPSCFPNKYI